MITQIKKETTLIGKVKLSFLEAGIGSPILLLHGWPTSSFLWRNIIPFLSENNRVIALDLPGFGESDKPLDTRYSFQFFSEILDGFLENLGISNLSLVLHDLGGPTGLYWATSNPDRISKLALLNTLVYPETSDAVQDFVRQLSTPGLRNQLTSPEGLKQAMRAGLCESSVLKEEVIHAVQAPFVSKESRTALARAGIQLQKVGFVKIAAELFKIKSPVRIIYGEQDRLLPDVAQTMARVQKDLPQAIVTSLPDCGHFLQEEEPAAVGKLLAEFFS
ncbi:MAG: alpha/beta fold hydrolase [Leptospira sp.]|nr:alpha/beta fold hydrolase [Leptospira sp.]